MTFHVVYWVTQQTTFFEKDKIQNYKLYEIYILKKCQEIIGTGFKKRRKDKEKRKKYKKNRNKIDKRNKQERRRMKNLRK